jgi:hypothetical protein
MSEFPGQDSIAEELTVEQYRVANRQNSPLVIRWGMKLHLSRDQVERRWEIVTHTGRVPLESLDRASVLRCVREVDLAQGGQWMFVLVIEITDTLDGVGVALTSILGPVDPTTTDAVPPETVTDELLGITDRIVHLLPVSAQSSHPGSHGRQVDGGFPSTMSIVLPFGRSEVEATFNEIVHDEVVFDEVLPSTRLRFVRNEESTTQYSVEVQIAESSVPHECEVEIRAVGRFGQARSDELLRSEVHKLVERFTSAEG